MIWKAKQNRDRQRRRTADSVKRRSCVPERLEARRLLAADPIHVGVVYIETDYLESDQDVGSDSRGDRFVLSFVGGAPDTELSELRIRTDKDGDGISVGDPLFDTELGGRGKSDAHGFQIVRVQSSDGRQVSAIAEVEDGGQELILRLANFRSGDRLEFTLDVDEVLRNAIDLAVFNDRLDVITSGQEFQDSILEAVFNAPHYETSNADAIFLNDYGSPSDTLGLNLPPDQGNGVDSRPNRSAAAVASTLQKAKPIDISGRVWLDNDLDAVLESGETLLSDVEIALWKLDPFVNRYLDTGLRATTDSDGRYQFSKSLGIPPGKYRVVEAQPAELYSVAAVVGTVAGVTTGQVESLDVLTDIDVPLGDTSAENYDFAEAQRASLSGYVYLDSDDDGVRDPDENGIAGVQVRLIPINTISLQSELTVTSAGDGSYAFTGLAPGTYEVIEVAQPSNLNDGKDTAGTIDGTVVGVADDPGDRISQIVLNGNDAGIEYNFGELPLGSLAGFVYLVAPGEDCNGVHDATGNTPLANVQLELQTQAGAVLARTRTAADGSYQFPELPVGDYRIVQFTPNGLIDGGADVGRIGNVKVGTAIGGGLIQDITLTAAGIGVEYNFCEQAPATLSGYVYHDPSDDGVRDSGESGIEGTQVRLIDSSGNVVSTTQTDGSGRYQFDDLPPGEYSILETQPNGFFDGMDTVGRIRGNAVGRVGPGNDSLTSIVLKQGDTGVEYNFGELLPATLAGRVHVDLDDDCVLDAGEETLQGVTIRLIDDGGNEVASTTTDADGRYSFENIRPGNYTVIEEQPVGFFDGKATAGTAGGVADGGSRIGEITLASGQIAVDYDFCERPPAEIGGSVFADSDGDCLFDPGETGIEGVRVELYDANGDLVATTRTNASGDYRFSNLPAGEYLVREIQPPGWIHGGQRAGSSGGDDSVDDVISVIPVGWGDRLTRYNFCELAPASISGIVFVDGNGDCVRDAGELPLAGVTIELRDATGTRVAQTTTDLNGEYRFDNLVPGEYSIFESQPAGLFHGGQVPGTGIGRVLGDDLLGVTLLAGQTLVDYNFCEVPPASVSGYVFVDDTGDCIREPVDRTLAGVVIELRSQSGSQIARTTTDANGFYRFDGLAAGQYEIFEMQPDGFFDGGEGRSTNWARTFEIGNGHINDDDLLGVTLSPGDSLVEYNFCELEGASVGGRVWQESKPNAQFDPGDLPIEGVRIDLIDELGAVTRTTTTDAAGNYRFDSVAPGIYAIRETQPIEFFDGGEVVGSAGGEIGGDDLLVGITLNSGTKATDYDFAEIPPAKITGYVFQDGDAITLSETPDPKSLREFRDGQLSDDDLRLGGVTIELRNVLGRPFLAERALPGVYPDGPIRTVTDASGYYEFPGLRPGTYHVYEVQPADYIDGLDTAGTVGGVAVNQADAYSDLEQITIQTLAASDETNPRDDAILLISLDGGSVSESNNFSEIVIQDEPEIPQIDIPRSENRIVTAPLESFENHLRLVSFAAPPTFQSPIIANDEWAVSWHLSVINGGFPRGSDGDEGGIFGVSDREMEANWAKGDHDSGRWTILSPQGEPLDQPTTMTLGEEDAIALAGDFDGDGSDEAVIFVAGIWFVDLNGNGRWDEGDLWIQLGTALDRPVVGDWDGDGKDDIGIFGRQWQRDAQRIKRDPGLPDPDNKRRRTVDSRQIIVRNEDRTEDRKRLMRRGNDGSLRADAVDHVFQYGEQTDTPLAGDWNGDGIDQIATFRGGQWMMDSDGDGRWTRNDERAEFGRPGDEPIVGDFNGDEIDEIGVVRGDVWIIDTDGDRRITGNDLRIQVPRASDDSQPVVGDFDGDGKDEPGYYDDAA